jgi:hypothetical protein
MEMVPLSSLPPQVQQQYKTYMFMMSRPRWDASSPLKASSKDDFLTSLAGAEARDAAVQKYVRHQRSQREQLFTGSASQPVGGRMQRQYKLSSTRLEWTDADEDAYQKKFGNKSVRHKGFPRPTGHALYA